MYILRLACSEAHDVRNRYRIPPHSRQRPRYTDAGDILPVEGYHPGEDRSERDDRTARFQTEYHAMRRSLP